MLSRLIHRRERRLATRDSNRIVRDFHWGIEHLPQSWAADIEAATPADFYREHTRRVMDASDDFYRAPAVNDYRLDGERLTWTSAAPTASHENNIANARLFAAPISKAKRASAPHKRAVIVLPQWNSDAESHVALCRLLNRLGITALRLTLPYHEARRPAELERADHLVSPDIGRTLQSVRQAVLDTRAGIAWLNQQGYTRLGIIGTSIGSCVAFLAFVHEPLLRTGVFNHVSSYFADVVWRGISTRHVRAGLEQGVTLDELREYWLPISPHPFAPRLLDQAPRPMRFIVGRYDLSFPADLSRHVIAEVRRLGLPLDAAWLPCGHYTLGENPWKYLDGWKIATFLRKHL